MSARSNEESATTPARTANTSRRHAVTNRLLVTGAGFFASSEAHVNNRDFDSSPNVFLLCTSGRGFVSTQAGTFEVRKADAILLLTGENYSYGPDTSDPWTVWWFHASGRTSGAMFARAHHTLDGPVAHLREGASTAALIGGIISKFDGASDAPQVRSSTKAWKAVQKVLDLRNNPIESAADPVGAALEYMHQHSPQRVPVEKLAALSGLRPSQFTALFRQ